MIQTIIVIVLLVGLIVYELYKQYEKFQVPSRLLLVGTAKETMVNLYWSKPDSNDENVYSYLIYMYEPNKDVNLITIKASNNPFYEKTYYNLDPEKRYKFKVKAISSDGVSEDSNTVELKPSDKNKKVQRPLQPSVNKISCMPDGTYKISSTCMKGIYPNPNFNTNDYQSLMANLTEKKEKKVLYF